MARKAMSAEGSGRPSTQAAFGRRCGSRALSLIVMLLIPAFSGLLVAASAQGAQPQQPLVIEVDKAAMIELPEPATTVFVASPDIADLQVPRAAGATRLMIFGKKAGSTTVFAVLRSGQIASYSVTVPRQLGELAAALKKVAPTANIEVASAPNGVTVSGSVNSPGDAQQLKAAARQFLGEKDSLNFNVAVAAATQVNLRVRIAEVSRSADKQFGFNWNALYNTGQVAVGLLVGREPLTGAVNSVTGATTTNFGNFAPSANNYDSLGGGYRTKGGKVNVSGLIDALDQEGLITVLAEPNLTAVSGETANFLAGGEFPVPVPQGLQEITIEWKKFGVSLDFTPTVLDASRLSIKVRPEVSELTATGSVVINGTTIPGLAVRRAETTVELASGQSFAIAGLFQNDATNQIQQFPWLGNLPILGALFRSTNFQRKESELVIIVTPYIVQPVAQASELRLPTDGVVFANDLEMVLLGRLTTAHPPADAGNSPPAPHLTGAAGFILEH